MDIDEACCNLGDSVWYILPDWCTAEGCIWFVSTVLRVVARPGRTVTISCAIYSIHDFDQQHTRHVFVTGSSGFLAATAMIQIGTSQPNTLLAGLQGHRSTPPRVRGSSDCDAILDASSCGLWRLSQLAAGLKAVSIDASDEAFFAKTM